MSQTELTFDSTLARERRDEGMERARIHADTVVNDWSERAYELLKWFIERTPTPFLTEDFRADVKGLLP